jgi:hypothetical protein
MRRPDQPELFAEVVETVRTRDRFLEYSDGSSATYRVKPPGAGWFILRDRERHTVWTRRRPVIWRPVHHRGRFRSLARVGGWGRQ